MYISVKCKCCVPVGCNHMRAEKCDSSTGEEKPKKPQTQTGRPAGLGTERPQSAPRPRGQPSMAMGQQVPALTGADGGDAWHCCGRAGDPLPAGMRPHRASQHHRSLDAPLPPWIPRRLGSAGAAARLLCQGQGNAIPSIEGWCRNPTSAA